MTWPEWIDWTRYGTLAPFTEERADIRTARICQFMVNLQRDPKKHPNPFPLEEFLIKFGDSNAVPQKVERKQTIEEQERNLIDWIQGSNQAYLENPQHGS